MTFCSANARLFSPRIKVSSLRLIQDSIESGRAAPIIRAERLVRHAAHGHKQAQHSSDANSEAASL